MSKKIIQAAGGIAFVAIVIITAVLCISSRPVASPLLGQWELIEVIGLPQGYTVHPRYRYGARWSFDADSSTGGLWQIDERGRLVFPLGLSRTAHYWHVDDAILEIYGYVVSSLMPPQLMRVDLVFVRVE